MKWNDIKKLQDSTLVQLAACVGQEIDRRWQVYSLSSPKVFRNCEDVYAHFHYRLWSKKQEHLYVLLLDPKNSLIEEKLVTLGTVNANLVHAREVFAPAIEKRATALLMIHNHPSGHATPSLEDLDVTQRLKKVGKLIGIQLLDHIIIGKNQYYSDTLKKVMYL